MPASAFRRDGSFGIQDVGFRIPRAERVGPRVLTHATSGAAHGIGLLIGTRKKCRLTLSEAVVI
jgi:hypothetical protein